VHDELPGSAEGEELLHVSHLAVGYDQPNGSVKPSSTTSP
jgi:hypothetical protein